jgi:hypothetical protein
VVNGKNAKKEREVRIVFIPPFWCGVLLTVAVEVVAIVIAAICTYKK